MHLTPKAPRYGNRALEGYSPTLRRLESALPSGFKFSRVVPPRGAMSLGCRPHDLRQMIPLARRLPRVGRQHTGQQIPYAVLHAYTYIRACGHGESPLLPRGISRGYGKGFEVQCDPRVAAGCQPAGSLICLLSLGSDGDLFRRSDTRGNHHFTNCGLGLGLRPKTSGPSVSHCDG